jgi:succinyl-diaminopimelate desuccinylase
VQTAVGEAFGSAPPVRGATYYTDGSVWTDRGIPIVIFGPGDDRLAHQPDERVRVEQLGRAARGYMAVLERLLAGGD